MFLVLSKVLIKNSRRSRDLWAVLLYWWGNYLLIFWQNLSETWLQACSAQSPSYQLKDLFPVLALVWCCEPLSQGQSCELGLLRYPGFATRWEPCLWPWIILLCCCQYYCFIIVVVIFVTSEEGGGFRMGNTCIPVMDSFWYLAKLIQLCKV